MTSTIFHSEAEVAEIGEAFLARTLPKPRWSHAAHFAAALWLMRRRPDLVPERDMAGLIRAYNEATGTPNTDTEGYHETITQASLRAARSFLAGRAPDEPLHETLNALLASPLGAAGWLLGHWRRETLFSPAARRAWTEPDLRPLPF